MTYARVHKKRTRALYRVRFLCTRAYARVHIYARSTRAQKAHDLCARVRVLRTCAREYARHRFGLSPHVPDIHIHGRNIHIHVTSID